MDILRQNYDFLESLSSLIAQLSLGLIFLWFGFVKFVPYEAHAIEGLVSNFPLTSWMYSFWSVQTVSNIFGVIEIITGLFVFLGIRFAAFSIIGSLMAIVAFIITLSFMMVVPIVQEGTGFPYLSPFPGQFLLKDVGLIALSFVVFRDAIKRL